jgi:uncharacterized membrane protein YqjE
MSTAVPPGSPGTGGDERSLGQIVSDVTQDLSALVKQEMELARTELKQEVAKAGKGAGLLGGAGVAGHLVLVFASLALTFLLDDWMPLELAFLITTIIWGIIAAVLAVTGRKALRESNPQLPRTQQTLKEDAAWARAQKN